MASLFVHHGSDLFNYDQEATSAKVLVDTDRIHSKVEYDEYVVYSKVPGTPLQGPVPKTAQDFHDETHITHRFSQDDTSGAHMLDLAFRHGFKLDRNGQFRIPEDDEDVLDDLHGRVRRVYSFLHLETGNIADFQ